MIFFFKLLIITALKAPFSLNFMDKSPASKKLSLKNSYGDTFDYQPSGKKHEDYRSTNAFISETLQKYTIQ